MTQETLRLILVLSYLFLLYVGLGVVLVAVVLKGQLRFALRREAEVIFSMVALWPLVLVAIVVAELQRVVRR